jgi:hypothetical protein
MAAARITTPVAFLIFNRPDTTQRVFAEIARARPPKLLVVADGPRMHRPGEAARVAEARSIIERVDWPCEVLTDFSAANLGCKRRVSSGMDWVFDQVEEAIILEDDCVPHPTFFPFCEELLKRYRDDERVAQIGGVNFQFGHRRNGDSYYFSRYNHIWGWASWRNRWQGHYDAGLKLWPRARDEGWISDMVRTPKEAKYWTRLFDLVHQGKIDTWDYQWTFACWIQRRLTILPNVNLISNIGFRADGTHTTAENKLAELPLQEMPFPLTHPVGVIENRALDRRTFGHNFPPLHRRVGEMLARVRSLFP